MSAISEFFNRVSNSVGIKFIAVFWDEHSAGAKPAKYCVYRFSGADDRVSSDNDAEITEKTYKISFFTKDYNSAEKDISSIINAVNSANFTAFQSSFEDYEKDTKYYHYEIEAVM